MSDLSSAVMVRKLEAERIFASVAFRNPQRAAEQCGWLAPDVFSDERLSAYWKEFTATKDRDAAAMNVDPLLLYDLVSGAPDEIYPQDLNPFAERILKERWLYYAAGKLADIALAVGDGSYEDAWRSLEALQNNRPSAEATISPIGDAFLEFTASLYEDGVKAVAMPFPKLHNAFGGWWFKNFYVICARPGVGKTALLLQAARVAAHHRRRVLFVSLEMSERDLIARMACGAAGISYRDMMAKRLSDDQRDKLAEASGRLADQYNNLLMIDDTVRMNTNQLWQKVASLKPDIVFTDHLRLFADDDARSNEVKRLGRISWAHKQISREFDIPVIAAAQLNRKLEDRTDKQPTLADLRDSGEIEENADVVIGIHRDRTAIEMGLAKTTASLVGLKFRNGPDSILVKTDFDGQAQWFDTGDKASAFSQPIPF